MDIDQKQYENKKKRGNLLAKIINILFIIGLIVGLYWAYQYVADQAHNAPENDNTEQQQEEENQHENDEPATKVETLTITEETQSRTAMQKVGTVIPYKKASLSAEASGILQNFAVEQGDKVKQKDTIVTVSDSIGTKVAEINYEAAQGSLENAEESYKSTTVSVEKDVQTAKLGIENAKLNHENAIQSYENLEKTLEEQIRSAKLGVQAAQLALQSAQEAYFNTEATSSRSVSNTAQQALTSLNASLSLVDSSVGSVNTLISMQTMLDDDVDSNDFKNLTDTMEDVRDSYHDIRDDYYYMNNSDINETKNILDDTLDLLEETQEMIYDAKDIIYNASDNENLQTLDNSYNTLLASIDQSKNGLVMSSQMLETVTIKSQLQPEGSLTKVEMAQQQVAAALQQLKQLEETRNAQLDNARHATMLAEKQIESAQKQYESAKAKGQLQKLGAKNQVNSLESQVDIAKANVDGTVLTAPFEGIVLETFMDEGNYVNPGQKIATIADMNKVYITVSVTTEELSFIKLGQKVTITAPGAIEKEGSVTKVIPNVDPVSKKVTVKIVIPNEDNMLLSGMFADVHFRDSKTTAPVISIPFKSVLFEENNPYVFIVENDKAIRTSVTLGDITGDSVEVKQGLKTDDTIITTGAKLISDGDSISY